MSWTLSGDKKAVSLAVNTSAALGGSGKKARVAHLTVLQKFLEAALFESNQEQPSSIDWSTTSTIHPQTSRFMLPSNPQTYAPLKLFIHELPSNRVEVEGDVEDGAYSLSEIDSVSTEDQETRRKILHDVFLAPLKKNLNNIVREGGEVGKEANSCIGTLARFEEEYKKAQGI